VNPELKRDLLAALEHPHRLGTIGGNLEEQLAHCASFSSVLAQLVDGANAPATAVDLGTGGGVPGIPLAAMWPQTAWTLVDMRTARADEVERTVLRLGFADRVQVIAGEAQTLGHDPELRETFDVAVARAFGPASILAECAAGVLRVGGHLIVSEPPAEEADRWPVGALEELGFGAPKFHHEEYGRFAVVVKVSETKDHFPRLPPRSNRGWPGSA